MIKKSRESGALFLEDITHKKMCFSQQYLLKQSSREHKSLREIKRGVIAPRLVTE